MQFVEYKKNSSRWKYIFLLFLFLCIIVISINVFKPKSKQVVCNLTQKQLEERMKEKENENYIIEDYFFYGDVLNIKHKLYTNTQIDDTTGKTIVLKNICSNEENEMVLEKFVDRHIDLTKLKTGVYKMYIKDQLTLKNIVIIQEIPEFNTTTKNNKHQKITFKKNEDNMLFLFVEEIESPHDKIDIAIDAPYFHKDLTGILQTENEIGRLLDDRALDLEKALNAQGYRALFIRNKQPLMDVYGDKGRFSKMYNQKMKYYILLDVNDVASETNSGLSVENSYLVSKNKTNALMYHLAKNTKFNTLKNLSVNEYGVKRNQLIKSELNQKYYDSNLYIREVGGYATQAATFSNNSKKNSAFALNNKFGIYSLVFQLAVKKNEKDVENIRTSELVAQIAKYWDDVR